MKIIAQNKKARHDYEILNEYEAGLCLLGSEMKSVRNGRANIQEGYIYIDDNGDAYLLITKDQQYIVPLSLYINDRNKAKLKIAIAKGKKLYDKRQDLKERDWKRDKERMLKENNR